MGLDWKWYCSNNEEFFHGEFATREEAIAVGFDHFGGEGTLYICEAKHNPLSCDVFDFDRIIEDFSEKNEEHWGEDGEPLADIKFKDHRILEQDLADVLRRYLAKNDALRSWAFTETRNREEINMEAGGWIDSQYYETIIMGAFRYALGRKTYVVMDTVNLLLREWDRLGIMQDRICEEIKEAIDSGRSGMEMDVAQWSRILAHRDELEEKRKAKLAQRETVVVGTDQQ